jgi:hypothetical protein
MTRKKHVKIDPDKNWEDGTENTSRRKEGGMRVKFTPHTLNN